MERRGDNCIASKLASNASPTGTGSTLKITLVWTDSPGAKLRNDLDLIIKASVRCATETWAHPRTSIASTRRAGGLGKHSLRQCDDHGPRLPHHPAFQLGVLPRAVARGEAGGQRNEEERTAFKSVGLALEDLTAATVVYESA
jgi:hypothetical protein